MPFEFQPDAAPPEPTAPPPAPAPARRVLPWLVSLLLLAAVAAAAWWLLFRAAPKAPVAAAPTAPAAPAALPEAPPEDAAPAPEAGLHGDALVRDWASRLVDGLDPRWTKGADLARRMAGAIYAVAQGESPRGFLLPLVPATPFSVTEEGEQPTIAQESYQRYDAAVRALATLHVERVAKAWAALRPLVGRAFREIAPRSLRLDDALDRALDQVLAAPVIDAPIHLTPKGAGYAFADPALEGLPPVQKLLLRTGPENERLLQATARKIARALSLPAGR
jgi:hypothetical protein